MIQPTHHIPILLRPMTDPVIQLARELKRTGVLVDCTLGGGGHTAALLQGVVDAPEITVLAIDQDNVAIARARVRFAPEIAAGRLRLEHGRMSELPQWVARSGLPLLGVIADLGFSSDQMDDAERGLSFRSSGPLDMRMDQERGVPLSVWLRQISERELADTIFQLGEERKSRRIAARIVEARRAGQFPTNPQELAELVASAVGQGPADRGRIHPATRTFQALRIAINGELEELQAFLDRGILEVQPGGGVAVLTFHSIEDRLVKAAFKNRELWTPLTKKPQVASDEECRENPRARSAKLRIAQRTTQAVLR